MDQYRNAVKHDIRMLNRDKRHHMISERQILEHQSSLPDVSDLVRWLDQDGSLCSEERSEELMRLHREGIDSLKEVISDARKPEAIVTEEEASEEEEK